jgi:hypothetical protein
VKNNSTVRVNDVACHFLGAIFVLVNLLKQKFLTITHIVLQLLTSMELITTQHLSNRNLCSSTPHLPEQHHQQTRCSNLLEIGNILLFCLTNLKIVRNKLKCPWPLKTQNITEIRQLLYRN